MQKHGVGDAERAWKERLGAYAAAYPELAETLARRLSGALPLNFETDIDNYIALCAETGADTASRKASQQTLNALGPLLPELLGGSADPRGVKPYPLAGFKRGFGNGRRR